MRISYFLKHSSNPTWSNSAIAVKSLWVDINPGCGGRKERDDDIENSRISRGGLRINERCCYLVYWAYQFFNLELE